jgi:hypothetical protein|tara:strand:- start:6877 stop:7065 length:189 start_codon:yes stop_codon:yes gene_type:complete
MKIEKDKLKNLINEEIERSFDTSDEGFVAAEQAIKKLESLNENQKINFLERLFNHINKNINI